MVHGAGLVFLAQMAVAAGYHVAVSPARATVQPFAGFPPARAAFSTMRANSQARRAASTNAKKKNGRRKTNKVNEFGFKYKTRFKTQTSKIDVLLLKPVSGLGEAGAAVSVSIPQWENSLRRSGAARLLRAGDPSVESSVQQQHLARTPISARPDLVVYDGVYSAASQGALANAAESSGVYVRSRGAATAAEHAIESLLRALGDAETAEVEHWTRESYAAMEAHRDADEEAACSDGRLRLPSRVLLVYGPVAEGLAAPTVLWCEPQSKSVLTGDVGVAAEDDSSGSGRLVLVPAVAGRVVDFAGRLLHAVPWCNRVDDAEASDGSQTRTVTVLNCWSDYAPTEEEEEEEEAEEAEEEEAAEEAAGAEAEATAETALGMDATRADAASASCEPKATWRRATVEPGVDALDEDSTFEWSFALDTFGSDEALVTRVLVAGQDAFFAVVNEPSTPQWLRTITPAPPLSVGIPSVDGAREERM